MSAVGRPHGEWFSPYFAPTTVLVAAIVLFLSVEAGRYAGGYYIQKDQSATVPGASIVATPLGRIRAQTPAQRITAKSHRATRQAPH